MAMGCSEHPTIEIQLTRGLQYPAEMGPDSRHSTSTDTLLFRHVCTNFDWNAAAFLDLIRERLMLDHTNGQAVWAFTTMAEICEAAAEGCGSCRLIQACVTDFTRGEVGPDVEMNITYGGQKTLSVDILLEDSCGQIAQTQLELFTLPGESCPWPNIGSEISLLRTPAGLYDVPGGCTAIVCDDSLSENAMAKIKQWIAECERDHPYCDVGSAYSSLNAHSNVLPSRLISVGAENGDVRLCCGVGTSTKYLALSYCWGRSGGLTLTQENQAAWTSRIPFERSNFTTTQAISHFQTRMDLPRTNARPQSPAFHGRRDGLGMPGPYEL
ncbi:Hypothetical predicted protein [Lecanosticta acicola]|uniref:Uncharacterized protein n=1 Tax=Lecanosticta acicola TaxID=111012 RepID=A0AAI8YXZ0_9PEZI|nr:Hypothetical predicted protein [Lecanosticta acicola]